MNKLVHAAAEYPVLIGITVFVAISLLLAVSLGVLMRRAGGSLKPLVFFFGFLAIIAVPQTVVHLLDAFVHARQIRVAPGQEAIPSPATAAPSALQPVSWAIVFGPNADPSLITDAEAGSGLHPQRRARSKNCVQHYRRIRPCSALSQMPRQQAPR